MDCVYPPLILINDIPVLDTRTNFSNHEEVVLKLEDEFDDVTDDYHSIMKMKMNYKLYSKSTKNYNSNSKTTYELLLSVINPIDNTETTSIHFIGYYFNYDEYFKVSNPKLLNTGIFTKLIFPNIKKMYISGTDLKVLNFANIPTTVEHLTVENTSIDYIDNIPKNIINLDVRRNNINYIDFGNSNDSMLEILNISHNKLEKLENLPKTLKKLYCSHNYFTDLPDISYLSNLQLLECKNNKYPLNSINISKNLEKLNLNFSGISSLNFLNNSTVKSLEVIGNNITELILPDNLLELYCTANKNIIIYPNECLKILHISGCNLTELPVLPKTLIELRATANFINSISKLPTPRNNINVYLNCNPIEKVYNEYFDSVLKILAK